MISTWIKSKNLCISSQCNPFLWITELYTYTMLSFAFTGPSFNLLYPCLIFKPKPAPLTALYFTKWQVSPSSYLVSDFHVVLDSSLSLNTWTNLRTLQTKSTIYLSLCPSLSSQLMFLSCIARYLKASSLISRLQMYISLFVHKLSYKFINYNIISFKSNNNIWSKCHLLKLMKKLKFEQMEIYPS